MKITRPPAPWLHHDEIRSLQTERNRLRHKAHEINTPQVWETFRKVRCLLKEKIKAAKQHFIDKALSSSKSKEVWRVIHRILHPPLQSLRLDVNSLNRYFANTAQRTLGSTNTNPKEDLFSFINTLQPSEPEEEPSSCGWLHQVR